MRWTYVYRIARGSSNTRRISIRWTRVSTAARPTQYELIVKQQRMRASYVILGESITHVALGENSRHQWNCFAHIFILRSDEFVRALRISLRALCVEFPLRLGKPILPVARVTLQRTLVRGSQCPNNQQPQRESQQHNQDSASFVDLSQPSQRSERLKQKYNHAGQLVYAYGNE